ncbi:GNAT family N-acetyltransferase [Thermoactinomyces sp. DSM 45892]|uniref:GNAT family N-acetyltransferase n=1 Tax=Thermoactinomyces sp. DSM 45892 TaxID=1882753 RepID=UPI0008971C9B|nr:GNAT family N-acetyltransferase [Thermoactinomyces sp. DSM 45892]SDZ24271.1 Acetyltransferase (GNAT) domain-containing protein [Thermoactinomyces sp. DSM 45892]
MKHTEISYEALVEDFVRGWSYCRFVPNSRLDKLGPMKHIIFGSPVCNRTNEFFVTHSDLAEGLQMLHSSKLYEPHRLTVFEQGEGFDLDVFTEQYGYTFKYKEYLMTFDLSSMNEPKSDLVCLIREPSEVILVNDSFQKEIVDPERIEDKQLFTYYVEKNRPVTHGRFSLIGDIACLDQVITLEAYRGKGLAKALCKTMLMDAKDFGAGTSVLATSLTGYPLYISLGYREVANMYVFEK